MIASCKEAHQVLILKKTYNGYTKHGVEILFRISSMIRYLLHTILSLDILGP